MPLLYDENEIHILKRAIPGDWKIIKAWFGNNEICVMISPDGKNFTSYDKAMAYVEKQRQQSRKRAGKENENQMLSRTYEESPLELPEAIQHKRRTMAKRSPIRNLRKIILEKEFVEKGPEGEKAKRIQKYLDKKERARKIAALKGC